MPFGPELLGHRLRKIHYRCLRHRVVDEVLRRIIGLLGRRLNNAETRLHVPQSGLRQKKRRVNIRLHGRVEGFVGNVAYRLRLLLPAGVVDEDVQTAKGFDRVFDQLLAERGVAKIAGQRSALAALLLCWSRSSARCWMAS